MSPTLQVDDDQDNDTIRLLNDTSDGEKEESNLSEEPSRFELSHDDPEVDSLSTSRRGRKCAFFFMGIFFFLLLAGLQVSWAPAGDADAKILLLQNGEETSSKDFSDIVEYVRSEATSCQRGDGVESMVIGVVMEDKLVVVGVGTQAEMDSLFEIGSITKTFTATLLADAILKKQVTLNQTVQSLFGNVKLPEWVRDNVVLRHLTTHTSGFPSVPKGFMSFRRLLDTYVLGGGPYKHVSEADYRRFLETVEPQFTPPGSQYMYSNFAVGLLGRLFVNKTNSRNYEELVTGRVCKPLDMKDTVVSLDKGQHRRLSKGHVWALFVGPFCLSWRATNWDIADPFAAAGALRSTMKDMLVYLKANMGLLQQPSPVVNPILDAMNLSHQVVALPYNSTTYNGPEMGMNWHRFKIANKPQELHNVVWHNGGTGGYSSFLGFFDRKENRSGVVLLANTVSMAVTELGVKILQKIG